MPGGDKLGQTKRMAIVRRKLFWSIDGMDYASVRTQSLDGDLFA